MVITWSKFDDAIQHSIEIFIVVTQQGNLLSVHQQEDMIQLLERYCPCSHWKSQAKHEKPNTGQL